MYKIYDYYFLYNIIIEGIGDWGLGIGDWGLGPIPNPHYKRMNKK